MSVEKGIWVTLEGKTRHGKNRINQHGECWLIIEVRNGRMLLQSSEKTDGQKDNKDFDWRWVDLQNDENFTWNLTE